MAFITSEEVKEKRNKIKAAFPAALGWKFSVTKDNHSSIDVEILQAPIELRSEAGLKYGQGMNVRPDYKTLNPIGKDVVGEIWGIINEGNFDKSDSMTDYFHVGFYASISIGRWNKDFKVVSVTESKKVEKALLQAA